MPLVDAAPPILAHELGFAGRESVRIELVRDMTWATVRDRLLYRHTDAAHMIAPLPIATTLGRGRPAVPIAVPFVRGLNGNAVTFSSALAQNVGLGDRLGEPTIVGAALKSVAAARKAAGKPLRFGVVHRYSSHNYMLRYWLAGTGIRPDADVEIVVTSPPRRGGPFRRPPERPAENADILARSEYLDAPHDAIERAITDRIRLVPGGAPIHYPDFMFQYREAANFP